jgi:hypothetical protein
MQSPFVRVDAVATCSGCHQRFQIKVKDFHRLPAMAMAGAGALPLPVEADGSSAATPHEPSPSPQREASGGRDTAESSSGTRRSSPPSPSSSTGRSRSAGASASSSASSSSSSSSSAAQSAAAAPKRSRSREKGQRMSQRQDHAALIVLVSVLLLLAGGVGVWLWVHNIGGLGSTSTRGPEREPVDNTPPPVLDPSIPIASGERLTPATWQAVTPPMPASTTNPGPIQLTDERWVILSSDHIFFSARASAPEADAYADSTLKIWVVDKAEQRVAAAESTIPLIVGKVGQLVRVQIPLNLYEKQVEGRMEWRVIPGKKLDVVMPIEVPSVQVLGSRKFTTLLLTYRNAGNKPINTVQGVFTAVDDRDQPAVQWRARWQKNLAPGASAQIAAAVPLAASERVTEWQTQLTGTWTAPSSPTESAVEPAAAAVVPAAAAAKPVVPSSVAPPAPSAPSATPAPSAAPATRAAPALTPAAGPAAAPAAPAPATRSTAPPATPAPAPAAAPQKK